MSSDREDGHPGFATSELTFTEIPKGQEGAPHTTIDMSSNNRYGNNYPEMGEAIVMMYAAAPVDSPWDEPLRPDLIPGVSTGTELPLPPPEDMRRIALESLVIEDLVKRVTLLEQRVLELEKELVMKQNG